MIRKKEFKDPVDGKEYIIELQSYGWTDTIPRIYEKRFLFNKKLPWKGKSRLTISIERYYPLDFANWFEETETNFLQYKQAWRESQKEV